jgi:hypothetical protein
MPPTSGDRQSTTGMIAVVSLRLLDLIFPHVLERGADAC